MVGFPRRLLESAALPLLLSALCQLGYTASLLPKAVLAAGLCILAIMVFNYINMTDHLFAVRRLDVFYKTNFAVFGVNFVFSMICVALYGIMGGIAPDGVVKEVISFLILPYRILEFPHAMPLWASAIAVNALFAIEIAIMPYIAVKRRR